MDAHLTADFYTNSFFAFALNIPSNWLVVNRSALETTNRAPAPPQQTRNPLTEKLFDLPDVELHNLITLVEDTNALSDQTMTALATTNLAFSVLGQNVQPMNAVDSGKDYLGVLAGVFAMVAAPDGRVRAQGPSEISVGGRKFYHGTFRRNVKTMQVSESIYARVDGGYVLVFVLSAPTEGELDKLEQIMASVRFY